MDFDGIYREHFHVVYLYLLGLSGDKGIAEELSQETFTKAIKGIDQFRGECDVKTWLCRIARNAFFTYCKKKKADFVVEDIDNWQDIQNDVRFEERLDDEEYADKIHMILHQMPEPYKEVFSLRIFGELPYEKIGRLFGKSANWACVTYHRAKDRICREMEEGNK